MAPAPRRASMAPMHAPTLTTARLTLTAYTPDDLEECAAMWAEPAVYTMIGGKPRSREEVWIRLLRSIGQWAAFGYGSWVVRARDDGRWIGEMGLIEARRAIVPAIDDAPEAGWTMTGAAHGRGYAREGLAAALGWVDARGLARTRCIIDPGNAPSLRLAAHLGYAPWAEGQYHDKPIRILERMAGAGAKA